MANYDEIFGLTGKDIGIGIKNYFVQLLTEAKEIKPEAQTLGALSSEKPTIIYVVGQTGAGKTTLSNHIRGQYKQEGEVVVEVGSDKIATFHKYWSEVSKLPGDERYRISRQFVRSAEDQIYGEIRENKLNIIREEVLNKGEEDYTFLEPFVESGYQVEINVMAVHPYESFLSCVERDIDLLELEKTPRPIPKDYHDQVCTPFLDSIMEMQRRDLITRTNVYARGEKGKVAKLAWTSEGDVRYPNAREAIIGEREKERARILQNPQEYLLRIDTAIGKIMQLVQDEEIRENYLKDLKQLKDEFEAELKVELEAELEAGRNED